MEGVTLIVQFSNFSVPKSLGHGTEYHDSSISTATHDCLNDCIALNSHAIFNDSFRRQYKAIVPDFVPNKPNSTTFISIP